MIVLSVTLLLLLLTTVMITTTVYGQYTGVTPLPTTPTTKNNGSIEEDNNCVVWSPTHENACVNYEPPVQNMTLLERLLLQGEIQMYLGERKEEIGVSGGTVNLSLSELPLPQSSQKEKNDYYDSYNQTTTTSNNIITDLLFDKYYPIVKVAYESDSMTVPEGNENYLSQINGTLVPFWESIDIVKNQGYSLKEIITLGTGNEDNPIIFYAIFFNNSNNKIEK